MALFLPESQTLFLHVPKTGGVWITETLPQIGIAVEPVKPFVGKRSPKPFRGRHILPGHCCRVPWRQSFAFVRHPVSWLESFWRYTQAHRHDRPSALTGGTAGFAFDEFVGYVIRCEPALATRTFERYAGPEGLELVDHVGRQESLAADLVRILTACGHDLTQQQVDTLQTASPRNTTSGATVWNERQLQTILALESVAIRRFYGDMPTPVAT